jgi:hypothetical protein
MGNLRDAECCFTFSVAEGSWFAIVIHSSGLTQPTWKPTPVRCEPPGSSGRAGGVTPPVSAGEPGGGDPPE